MARSEYRDATLACTRCGHESLCGVQGDTEVGDVLDVGECDGCDPFRVYEDGWRSPPAEDAEPVRFTARVVRVEEN